MNSKLSAVLLIFALSLNASYGQDIFCSYTVLGGTHYSCDLTIQNPNGFNNFTEIRGTHIPGWTNEHVTSVGRNSASNTINVPSIICNTFPNVGGLELWAIGIERINADSFRNCRSVAFISVGGNRITQIEAGSFSENWMLRTLHLDGNSLTTLPEDLFLSQQSLSELLLSRNSFTDLPINIFSAQRNLRILEMADCQLSHLRDEWFRNLWSIETLNLASNQLQDLPRNVFNPMRRLFELDLDFNQLKVVHSDWFGSMPNLGSVSLRANQINAVDERFIDNTGVSWLRMLNNICVNELIIDQSPSRQQMRAALQTCFQNFQY